MNKGRMAKKIRDIERFFRDLGEVGVTSVEDLKDKEKFYAVSMILFSIANRAIDLAEEIVSAKKLGLPESYREIFSLLERDNVIDEKLFRDLSALVHFRNLAAHEYHTFTEDDVFKAFRKINAVKRFVAAVKNLE